MGRRGISLREATKRYVLIKSLPNTEIMWVRQRKKGGDKREKGKDVFTYLGGGGEKVLFEVQNQPKLEEAGYRRRKSTSIRQRKSYTCKTSEKIKPRQDILLFLVLFGSV